MTKTLIDNVARADGIALGPVGIPLGHISYVVEDMNDAVAFWAAEMHAGPFFLIENITFDTLETSGGEPAVFEHSTAFGQWGEIAVELQVLHKVQPEALREKLSRAINHISYSCRDAAAVSSELEARGMPRFLYGQAGATQVRFHDVPMLAHAIELNQRSDGHDDFFAMVKNAARNWNGENPLRSRPS